MGPGVQEVQVERLLPQIAGQCVDIWEHFPVMRDLAQQCESIVEMGVRGGCSSYALLAGLQKSEAVDKWMVYLDVVDCRNKKLEEMANACGIGIEFVKASSKEVDIPECDLLFIDTLHTYGQLVVELEMHQEKARKYIVMHDVDEPWGFKNEVDDGSPDLGLKQAVYDFLLEHEEWKIKDWYTNCHGLAVLERVDEV